MQYEDYFMWLKADKNMGERSAKDTVSRVKRALHIIAEDSVDAETIKKLNESSDFKELSMYVKSQLRRAITLYLEFVNI